MLESRCNCQASSSQLHKINSSVFPVELRSMFNPQFLNTGYIYLEQNPAHCTKFLDWVQSF
jgi:hypothetical protein